MPKQYRVIQRTELMSSYIIEVPDDDDDLNLHELLEDNYADGWQKHVVRVVYQNDPNDSHVVEAYSLKEPIDPDGSLGEWTSNDDEIVFQDWE